MRPSALRLETELALSLMQLYHAGRLKLPEVIAKFTINPARLLYLDKGTLAQGADADITILDPDLDWRFDKNESASKSSNSPYYGWTLKGKAVATIVGGEKVWVDHGRLVGA
jgi:dihydroorotase